MTYKGAVSRLLDVAGQRCEELDLSDMKGYV